MADAEGTPTWQEMYEQAVSRVASLRAEVERLRGIVQADLEEKAEAWGEVERLRAVLYRIADPLTIWPVATDRSNPWQEAARAALRTSPSPPTVPPCPNCGSASTRYTRADSGECNVCGCIFVWSVLSQKTESGEETSHG
jgi:hypothetical protein